MFAKCAWCGADMGEKVPLDDKNVTHGICEDCYIKELMKAPAASFKIKGDRTLFTFQIINCHNCVYANTEKVWTTSPCCRCATLIKVKDRLCLTRKPLQMPSEQAVPNK